MSVTIINACLRDGRGGSPTSVLWDTGQSDAARRQVSELSGTSHAVFIADLGDHLDRPRVELRFFTKERELPACEHGTVAALAFLAEHAKRTDYQATLLVTGRSFAGDARRERGRMIAAFDPGEVELRESNAEERGPALEALGQHSEILASEICVASVGRPRLLVPIALRSGLADLTPDYERLRAGCDRLGLLGCYVHSVPTADGQLAARLARRGMPRITVDMGDSLNQPARITATAKWVGANVQIRVGGAVDVAGPVPSSFGP
jgi:trans-2,3-dihydro-3-hydroxyanthranilate isomerase